MVNLTQIELGLMNYIEAEIIAKAAPLQKFMTGTAVALAAPKFKKMILDYTNNPVMKTLEVVDENGMVDIDKVYTAAKEAYKKSGSISAFGLVFDEKDLDKLYEHIKKAV